MKILIIEHFLPSNKYTLELCDHLSKYCDITLLTSRNFTEDVEEEYIVKPCLLYQDLNNKLKSGFFILVGWFHIIYEMLFGKYDIIHVQTFKVPAVEMLFYKLFAKGRLVHTVHNIIPHETKNGDRKLYSRFYNCCSGVIVHNEYCKQVLQNDFGIERNIFVMPHGIYSVEGSGELHESQINDKLEILQFGTIRKYKGIDILLGALSKLDDETKKRIHVTIAGKQYASLDDTNYLDIIKRYNLKEVVTFIQERISDTEMSAMYRKADVCVFPYREIYGSGALLMAYTFGKPVIVSDVPALVEETEAGQTGLLFKSENEDDLARAIMEFVSMPKDKKSKFKAKISELVEKKYNWSQSSRLLYSYYQRVIEMKKR